MNEPVSIGELQLLFKPAENLAKKSSNEVASALVNSDAVPSQDASEESEGLDLPDEVYRVIEDLENSFDGAAELSEGDELFRSSEDFGASTPTTIAPNQTEFKVHWLSDMAKTRRGKIGGRVCRGILEGFSLIANSKDPAGDRLNEDAAGNRPKEVYSTETDAPEKQLGEEFADAVDEVRQISNDVSRLIAQQSDDRHAPAYPLILPEDFDMQKLMMADARDELQIRIDALGFLCRESAKAWFRDFDELVTQGKIGVIRWKHVNKSKGKHHQFAICWERVTDSVPDVEWHVEQPPSAMCSVGGLNVAMRLASCLNYGESEEEIVDWSTFPDYVQTVIRQLPKQFTQYLRLIQGAVQEEELVSTDGRYKRFPTSRRFVLTFLDHYVLMDWDVTAADSLNPRADSNETRVTVPDRGLFCRLRQLFSRSNNVVECR